MIPINTISNLLYHNFICFGNPRYHLRLLSLHLSQNSNMPFLKKGQFHAIFANVGQCWRNIFRVGGTLPSRLGARMNMNRTNVLGVGDNFQVLKESLRCFKVRRSRTWTAAKVLNPAESKLRPNPRSGRIRQATATCVRNPDKLWNPTQRMCGSPTYLYSDLSGPCNMSRQTNIDNIIISLNSLLQYK